MKKIAVINDISGLGKCSLSAALPVLSVMGHHVCPIPTAVLTAQTGYDHYHMTDLSQQMSNVIEDWKNAGEKMDGFYSGFLSSPSQYEKVLHIYESLKKKESILLVDPIMGDHGVPFSIYSEQLREGMISLIKQADITTPNLTEACLLTKDSFECISQYQNKEDQLKAVEEIGYKVKELSHKEMTVVITGIRNQEKIGNLCVTANKVVYHEQQDLLRSYSGTGDLLASCILGYRMNGVELETGLKKTMKFLELSIKDSVKEDIYSNAGVNFETYLREL